MKKRHASGKVEARYTSGFNSTSSYKSVFDMVAAITADEVMEEVNNAKRMASPH